MRIERLVRFYAVLLRLYPPGFRAEFGEEMQSVVAAEINEAPNEE